MIWRSPTRAEYLLSLPTAGVIVVRETAITALPEPQRDRFRAEQIGYVFQTLNLLPAFSALENVMLAMLFGRAVQRRQQQARAATLAELGTRRPIAAEWVPKTEPECQPRSSIWAP